MTRVVLDTNVVVSALISPFGNEAQVLLAVHRGTLVPCFSRRIADEYAEVLVRPKFGFSRKDIDGLVGLLNSRGLVVQPKKRPRISPDPDDDEFIACAIAADAEYLVTGNKRHFPQQGYGQTKVVSSRELLEFLNTR